MCMKKFHTKKFFFFFFLQINRILNLAIFRPLHIFAKWFDSTYSVQPISLRLCIYVTSFNLCMEKLDAEKYFDLFTQF